MEMNFEGPPANDNRFTPEQVAIIEKLIILPGVYSKFDGTSLDESEKLACVRDLYYQKITQNSDLKAIMDKYPSVPEQTIKELFEMMGNNDTPPAPGAPEVGAVIPMRKPETLNVKGEAVQKEPHAEDQTAA